MTVHLFEGSNAPSLFLCRCFQSYWKTHAMNKHKVVLSNSEKSLRDDNDLTMIEECGADCITLGILFL
jgi:hypothetical protein